MCHKCDTFCLKEHSLRFKSTKSLSYGFNMKKVACIFSGKPSGWVSCQTIVSNLVQAYVNAFGRNCIEAFNYEEFSTDVEVWQLADKIKDYSPDCIVFLDHNPHPLRLFKAILPLYEGKKVPKIVFHVFGDFTIFLEEWAALGAYLEKVEVLFFAASERQKMLINGFLKKNDVVVCPFPMESGSFGVFPDLRKSQRESWGNKDKDHIFVYTGRLSSQKRILTLLKLFEKTFSSQENAYLYLFGFPDSLGDPFLGKNEVDGEYFRKYYKYYESFPRPLRNRVKFMGHVPRKELVSVYNGADTFISLSVHNDEDYGMSVAEAQSCGLYSILTDWGGFSDFESVLIKEAVRFVPVKIGLRNKLISNSVAEKMMMLRFEQGTNIDRRQLSLESFQRFGIERVATIISENVLSNNVPFSGFSELFYQVVGQLKVFQPRFPYVDIERKLNKLYRAIYANYVRKT